MKLALLVALGLAAVACGGRQAPSARPTADRSARPRPTTAARPPANPAGTGTSPAPAPPHPQVSQAPAAPVEGQQAIFVPTGAEQVFVRRMLDVIDEVAAVVERNQSACDRMAAELEILLQRNQDLIGMVQHMKGNPAREKWMQEQAMERLNKTLPRMMTGFQNCQNDARMQALIKRLGS